MPSSACKKKQRCKVLPRLPGARAAARARTSRRRGGARRGHRPVQRDAEALVHGRVRYEERSAVEPCEIGVADLAEPAHAVVGKLHSFPTRRSSDLCDGHTVTIRPRILQAI